MLLSNCREEIKGLKLSVVKVGIMANERDNLKSYLESLCSSCNTRALILSTFNNRKLKSFTKKFLSYLVNLNNE